MSATALLATLLAVSSPQQEVGPLWMRHPAVSPDGTRIAFSYMSDLWVVSSSGGDARPLTRHPAVDFRPVWSPDGSTIAFQSDRHGNFDVFVVPAVGGEATRLTFHSANDEPLSFSADGMRVLFSSSRSDDVMNAQFPSGVLPELYAVSMDGGTPERVLTTPALDIDLEPGGSRMLYHDQKGYEDAWRKHHTSSIARDIWVLDTATGSHAKLTEFAGEDRTPVWGDDGASFFYLSERSGSFNVWRMSIGNPAGAVQVTSHENHPVRSLTRSDPGDLVYGYDGEIYRVAAGGTQSIRVPIALRTESGVSAVELERITSGATEMALSPDGKEVAFVVRGEVFVTAVDFPTTRRVTDTPSQERSVSFSPDGRSLLYAAERGTSWGVYETSLARSEEARFSDATLLTERVVVDTPAEEFQPEYSPDGTEVAYLEDRVVLRVVPRAGGESRTVMTADHNKSYSDGDQWYQWSSDGEQFLVAFMPPETYQAEVGLVPAAGGTDPTYLTRSGYFDFVPRWMPDGQGVYWQTDRLGLKSHDGNGAEVDVFGMFFSQAAVDDFDLSKEERAALQPADDADEDEEEEEEETGALEIDLDGIEDRVRRLTIHSSRVGDALLTPDLEKLIYLTRFESGYDLWMHDLVEEETRRIVKLDGSDEQPVGLRLDEEGEKAFVLTSGRLAQVSLADGQMKPIAFQAEMNLDESAERAYLFEHVWRQIGDKFYTPDMHGVDWTFYKHAYARFLPHINNDYDFQVLLSEMLGELNASHTGARYRPTDPDQDVTAALGVFFDRSWDGEGLRIAEVVAKGPLVTSKSRATAGTVVTAIDGLPIEGNNYYGLLNRKAGKTILLSFRDPESGESWDERAEPITLRQESELLYERWVESRRAEVERLSDGRLGYVHVRGMNDASYRDTYAEVLGRNLGKEALVVDTRFNGGGNLHDQLVTFLGGERYLDWAPPGRSMGGEPVEKWQKPSIVVMSESNYSDAHIFPWAYKELGIGELVGMPVPGTGTAVWWETLQTGDLVFGIPQWGTRDRQGRFLENMQLEPDHMVPNDPESVAEGRDRQLEKAVEVLLEEVGRRAISEDGSH